MHYSVLAETWRMVTSRMGRKKNPKAFCLIVQMSRRKMSSIVVYYVRKASSSFVFTHKIERWIGPCCLSSIYETNMSVSAFSLPFLKFGVFIFVHQTTKDPSGWKILCCYGYQADPPNTAADLHINNAVWCLTVPLTDPPPPHTPTPPHTHPFFIFAIQKSESSAHLTSRE